MLVDKEDARGTMSEGTRALKRKRKYEASLMNIKSFNTEYGATEGAGDY